MRRINWEQENFTQLQKNQSHFTLFFAIENCYTFAHSQLLPIIQVDKMVFLFRLGACNMHNAYRAQNNGRKYRKNSFEAIFESDKCLYLTFYDSLIGNF